MADEDNPEAPTSMVWALPVRKGPARLDRNEHTNISPFPLVIYIIENSNLFVLGKPQGPTDLFRIHSFTHNPHLG